MPRLGEGADRIQLTDLQSEEKGSTATNCSFLTFGYYSPGICTYYGACRVDSMDYMYKGGCGELARWGEKKIHEQEVSKHV